MTNKNAKYETLKDAVVGEGIGRLVVGKKSNKTLVLAEKRAEDQFAVPIATIRFELGDADKNSLFMAAVIQAANEKIAELLAE